MLISFIIPVFDVSIDLLERAIGSVLQQNGKDIEIIVVDDGSKQENAILYEKLCGSHAEICYYRKENAGPSAARNYGVERATGEYVFFLDADDYIAEVCIEQAIAAMAKYHPDIIFGYTYKDLADEGSIRYKMSAQIPEELLLKDKEDLISLLNHILGYTDTRFIYEHGYISDGPWCRFFLRSLFHNNHFDAVPKWNEDTLWNIELLKSCHKVVICRSLWYVYAVRKGSAMQGYRDNCYEEFLYITEKVSEKGHILWRGEIDRGVSYRIWHDIFILSRGLIFNERNEVSFLDKYGMLKNAIESRSYQKTVKTVDFSREKRRSKRIVKEFLNMTMKMHCYCLTYITIRCYVRKS